MSGRRGMNGIVVWPIRRIFQLVKIFHRMPRPSSIYRRQAGGASSSSRPSMTAGKMSCRACASSCLRNDERRKRRTRRLRRPPALLGAAAARNPRALGDRKCRETCLAERHLEQCVFNGGAHAGGGGLAGTSSAKLRDLRPKIEAGEKQ